MKRHLLFSLLLAPLALSAFGAETHVDYKGLQLSVVGAERVSAYRDLKVKNEKKEDLLIVRLEVRWTAENRYLLVEDDDLHVRDAGGRNHKCAFTFVQSTAEPEAESAVVEIPFRVKKDATIVSLEIGKTVLPIEDESQASD